MYRPVCYIFLFFLYVAACEFDAKHGVGQYSVLDVINTDINLLDYNQLLSLPLVGFAFGSSLVRWWMLLYVSCGVNLVVDRLLARQEKNGVLHARGFCNHGQKRVCNIRRKLNTNLIKIFCFQFRVQHISQEIQYEFQLLKLT